MHALYFSLAVRILPYESHTSEFPLTQRLTLEEICDAEVKYVAIDHHNYLLGTIIYLKEHELQTFLHQDNLQVGCLGS